MARFATRDARGAELNEEGSLAPTKTSDEARAGVTAAGVPDYEDAIAALRARRGLAAAGPAPGPQRQPVDASWANAARSGEGADAAAAVRKETRGGGSRRWVALVLLCLALGATAVALRRWLADSTPEPPRDVTFLPPDTALPSASATTGTDVAASTEPPIEAAPTRAVEESVAPRLDKPAVPAGEKPAVAPAARPVAPTVEKSDSRLAVERSPVAPVAKPSVAPLDRPAASAAEKPAAAALEKPASPATEKPTAAPPDRPASPATEKPAASPAEKPRAPSPSPAPAAPPPASGGASSPAPAAPPPAGEQGALDDTERKALRRRLMRACAEERPADGLAPGRKLLARDALDWQALLCLAAALRGDGHSSEALALYRRFVVQYPGNRFIADARAAIAELANAPVRSASAGTRKHPEL